MPFEKLEVVVRSGRSGLPVSVSLSGREGGLPACLVSLTAELAKSANIKPDDRFNAFIGSGQQIGLLQLAKDSKGLLKVIPLKKGGVKFNLGYIERFGMEFEKKQFCHAEVIGDGRIEIGLPEWARDAET